MAEYIERNELVKNLDRFAPEHLTPLIRSLIEKQPTADVKEVVYAEWVECSNELNKYCSNCKKIHGDIYYKPPFCENCGATMIMKSGVKEQ